jgi:hypothetical protein
MTDRGDKTFAMLHTSRQILKVLDDACRAFTFPMLDNAYLELAATRMSLFRSSTDWALVFEVFGHCTRTGLPDTHITTFASRLHNRNKPEDYVNEKAYQDYLANNPHNESSFVYPIVAGPWIDAEDCRLVAQSGQVQLRDLSVPLPPCAQYEQSGIKLEGERPAVTELCRYLAGQYRDRVLALPNERRLHVLPEMPQILQLEEWRHPDIAFDGLPSRCKTFKQLAEVLVTGDISLYRPSARTNTHWFHWSGEKTMRRRLR